MRDVSHLVRRYSGSQLRAHPAVWTVIFTIETLVEHYLRGGGSSQLRLKITVLSLEATDFI